MVMNYFFACKNSPQITSTESFDFYLLSNKGFDLLDFVKNKEVFQYKDGYVDLPSKPGLGLEMDEDRIKEISQEGLVWTNPQWKNYDGTIAEW